MATKKNTTAKAAPKSQEQHTPRISVRIDKMLDSAASSTRAFASANIAGAYAIHGIRVVDSQKGLFVSMPQNSYPTENGETRYSDVFHPITAQARTELYEKVLEAYEQKLEEGQEQDEGEEVSEEADQGMEQSLSISLNAKKLSIVIANIKSLSCNDIKIREFSYAL